LQVLVRDNNVDQALRVLKKKMQREGIFREMKQRKAYEKPSVRRAREQAEAVRRARKQARKTAIREGLIAAPKPKPRVAGAGRRPGLPSATAPQAGNAGGQFPAAPAAAPAN
jgi:small subunit ribosomal protein S21